MWSLGNVLFFAVIVIVNAKILTISNSYSPFLLLAVGGSIGMYLLTWFVLNGARSSVLYQSFEEILTRKEIYILLMFTGCIAMFEYLFNRMEYHATVAPFESESLSGNRTRSIYESVRVKKVSERKKTKMEKMINDLKMDMIEENSESRFSEFSNNA